MADKDVIGRGRKAEALMNDDLIKEARDHIEAELWRLFKESGPQDVETLKYVKGMQYFHKKYFEYLKRVVNEGKFAVAKAKEKGPIKRFTDKFIV